MRNNPIHIRKLRVPVYGSSLWIVICSSIPKAIDHVEDLIDKRIIQDDHKNTIRAYTYAYTDHSGSQKFILFLRPSSKPGEIAHEVKHLINIIFSWNGVKLTTSNDEHECYYLEDLINKVHNTILSYKRKHKQVKRAKINNVFSLQQTQD